MRCWRARSFNVHNVISQRNSSSTAAASIATSLLPSAHLPSRSKFKHYLHLITHQILTGKEIPHSILSSSSHSIPRLYIYERLILSLAKLGDWSAIRELLSSNEGGDLKLTDNTSVLDSLVRSPFSNNVENMKELITNTNLPESAFCALIAHLSRQARRDGVDYIKEEDFELFVNAYAKSRGENWKPSYNVASVMMGVYARTRRIDRLVRWAKHSEKYLRYPEEERGREHRVLDIASRMALVDPWKTDILEKFLLRHPQAETETEMELAVKTDVVFFNILLSAAVKTNRFGLAQRVYDRLISMSTIPNTRFPRDDSNSLAPDGTTFSTMFKAWFLFREYAKPWRRPSDTGEGGSLEIPPRVLFSHLIRFSLHFPYLPSNGHRHHASYFTISILKVIVRTFINLQDYPGALTVINTFGSISPKLKLTKSGEEMVWRRIVKRVMKEGVSKGWGARMVRMDENWKYDEQEDEMKRKIRRRLEELIEDDGVESLLRRAIKMELRNEDGEEERVMEICERKMGVDKIEVKRELLLRRLAAID